MTIIIVTSIIIAYLAYNQVRHTINERRNDELNNVCRKEPKKPKRSKTSVKNQLETIGRDLESAAGSLHPVGDISKLKREPKDGDVGSLHGRSYFYYNGKWEEVAGLI